jgi:hypothetical protein
MAPTDMASPGKRYLGVDLIDIAIQAGITICILGFVGVNDGPDGLYPLITGGSLGVLGLRRWFALRRASPTHSHDPDRLAEVEERVGYLEGLQDRVLELEERLDFAERMLAKKEPGRLPSER